jgi:hypothetical protein
VAALTKQLQDHALLWRHPRRIVEEKKVELLSSLEVEKKKTEKIKKSHN